MGTADYFGSVVGADRAEIAGSEVAFIERGPRQVGIVEISRHAVRRIDFQFACLAVLGETPVAFPDSESHVARRTSDRTSAGDLCFGAQTEVARSGLGRTVEVINSRVRPNAGDGRIQG